MKISKSNGKIANDIEVKSGNYDTKDCYVVTESDPVSTDGKNRWQEGIDNWRKDSDHMDAKKLAKSDFYENYSVEITEVIDSYGWDGDSQK